MIGTSADPQIEGTFLDVGADAFVQWPAKARLISDFIARGAKTIEDRLADRQR